MFCSLERDEFSRERVGFFFSLRLLGVFLMRELGFFFRLRWFGFFS